MNHLYFKRHSNKFHKLNYRVIGDSENYWITIDQDIGKEFKNKKFAVCCLENCIIFTESGCKIDVKKNINPF